MSPENLLDLLERVRRDKAETRTLELKSAAQGCPKRLYDTISSFSNQDDGGIILFGVDETDDFREVGVYDPQDLQRQINAQCLQMQPKVRPVLTVAEKDGKWFVAAEIPAVPLSERPCHYAGVGRIRGSYVRIGESDEPMSECEIYSYEAFRKRYQDDSRPVRGATLEDLHPIALERYLERLKAEKINLSRLEESRILSLMSIVKEGAPTLLAVLLFGLYPQAHLPQLSIVATAFPGRSRDELNTSGARFLDDERIEGTIPEMLRRALNFIERNTRRSVIVNSRTGMREDRRQYPEIALREALLNALVHRDYSIYSESRPIRLEIFQDRIVISSPGGLFGRIPLEALGRAQPDTRNPTLAGAMEVLGLTENRFSGIPIMRKAMREHGLPEPVFEDARSDFRVTFKNETLQAPKGRGQRADKANLLEFCRVPRSRAEIADYLGLASTSYVMRTFVDPLLKTGELVMTKPEAPQSRLQRFVAG